MIISQTLLLLLGLFLVVKGADFLLSSSIALGKRFKVSEFFIGLIVIGFGTSLPELLVSVDAVMKNSPGLSIGNVIGSNISNLLLVLGFALLISECLAKNVSKFDILFHFFIHIIFLILFIFFKFDFLDGLFFIILFFSYLFFCFKKSGSGETGNVQFENDNLSNIIYRNPIKWGIPVTIISIFLTIFGAELTVVSAIKISVTLGISESFLGLTIIALGTSLPEIATSIKAAKRGKSEIILGNIIGSNIYNLLLILGISSLFSSFSYEKDTLLIEIIFLTFCTLIFSLIIFYKSSISKRYSYLFLFFYIIYLIWLYLTNF